MREVGAELPVRSKRCGSLESLKDQPASPRPAVDLDRVYTADREPTCRLLGRSFMGMFRGSGKWRSRTSKKEKKKNTAQRNAVQPLVDACMPRRRKS